MHDRMARGQIPRTIGRGLFAGGRNTRVDAGNLRSKDDSPAAEGLGGRRTKARRGDFC